MKDTLLLSTSHIARQSVRDIKKAFVEFEPEIVAVELDPKRMYALMHDQKSSLPITLIRQIGVAGYLFALIGSFLQRKLGGLVGTKPGIEMLTAVKEAHRNQLPVFLIDQDVEITLRNLSTKVPTKEKWKIVWEIISGVFRKEKISIDLNKVPDQKVIELLTGILKKKFPKLYKVLVSDRNRVMVNNIKAIRKANPEKKLLVVIGAGHEKGMKTLLKE